MIQVSMRFSFLSAVYACLNPTTMPQALHPSAGECSPPPVGGERVGHIRPEVAPALGALLVARRGEARRDAGEAQANGIRVFLAVLPRVEGA